MVQDGHVRFPPYKTVILSQRDVEDADRLLARITSEGSDVGSSHEADVPLSLVSRAQRVFNERQRRYATFGKGMFGEPAWDILLLVYVLRAGQRPTVSRLAELSGASKSTALRWLDYLERQRWIRRDPHPTDKRAVFIELTENGREALDAYLSVTPPI